MNTHDNSSTISPDFFKYGQIEIQGENGAFYPGYIFDVENNEKCRRQDLSTAGGDSGLSSNGAPNSTSKSVNSEPLITVTFKNNSFPQSQLPISRIRLPPVPTHNTNNLNILNDNEETVNSIAAGLSSVHLASNVSSSNVTSTSAAANNTAGANNLPDENMITIGMEVEVFSSCSKDEPKGWWRAIVKMTKGNLLTKFGISSFCCCRLFLRGRISN